MIYVNRLILAWQRGEIERGDVFSATVHHDTNCPALRGGRCNCDPDIFVNTPRGQIEVLDDGSTRKVGDA